MPQWHTDSHRHRSGWNSGGDASRALKASRCRVGGVWGGVSPPQLTMGSGGSVMSSPSGVRGRAPAENGFWHILKARECSFLYLYDKIWGGGEFALASPTPNSGGLVPPSHPSSTPMQIVTSWCSSLTLRPGNFSVGIACCRQQCLCGNPFMTNGAFQIPFLSYGQAQNRQNPK